MGYKSINRLVKDIQKTTGLIESGDLSLPALDILINNVQILQERLFILRYKILEERSKGSKKGKKKATEEVEIPVLFKVEPIEQDSIHPNQRSLIDVIEEIEEERKPLEVQSALFSMAEEPVEEFNPPVKDKPKKTKEKTKTKKEKTPKSSKKEPVDKKESLVEKLNSAPITDLKKSINLNLKFRFIKALYNNESDVYNSSIEELNQTKSIDDAKAILKDVKEMYQWEEDLEEEVLLLELLERKHEA